MATCLDQFPGRLAAGCWGLGDGLAQVLEPCEDARIISSPSLELLDNQHSAMVYSSMLQN